MEKSCKKCKWRDAPCDFEKCGSYGFWELAPTPLEKWDVPEGCEIACAGEKHALGYMYNNMLPTVWNLKTGACESTVGFSDAGLIPKPPPIEETEEYKAFKKWTMGAGVVTVAETFESLKKIFKMELRGEDEF